MSTACFFDKEEESDGIENTIRSVKAEVAVTIPARIQRRFPSVLQPPDLVQLAFEVSGRVAEIDLRVGQSVAIGETLATVEPLNLDLRLKQAKAALTEAKVAAANARKEADRQEGLFDKGVIARVTRDNAVTQAEQAEARQAQAQSNVDLLGESRADAELKAPFDGVINSVEVQDFASVQAGQPVLTLYPESALQASILVSFDVAQSLDIGGLVQVLPADALAQPIAARVTEIGQRAPAVSSLLGAPLPMRVRAITREGRSATARAAA